MLQHPQMHEMPPARHVLLAGATGLVGREILRCLLASRDVAVVHALVRRPIEISHPKLVVHRVEFGALPPLPARLHEVYLALGTTIKIAGSQAAFRVLDFDTNLAIARTAQPAGVRRAGLVSAMGANAKSRLFYSRVKGELEEALTLLGFERLVIARPSLLLGDRAALGQPTRAAEKIGAQVARFVKPVLPRDWRPVEANLVAKALVDNVTEGSGTVVLRSGALQRR